MFISLKPKPKGSLAETFGHTVVHKFLTNFSVINGDEICVDDLAMMTFSKALIEWTTRLPTGHFN